MGCTPGKIEQKKSKKKIGGSGLGGVTVFFGEIRQRKIFFYMPPVQTSDILY